MTLSGMARIAVLIVLLFVGLDAALCPVVCLATDAASHQTSDVPSHGSGKSAACGGACWSGVTVSAVDSSVSLVQDSARLSDRRVESPSRSPIADIDHPPRLT